MRWGLIPSWWKKSAKEAPSTFNARAETVAEKPMFRAAFNRRNISRSTPLTDRYVPASTTIEPVICGCKAQKYVNVPGVVNVNENLSPVSSTFDLNTPVFDVTV
jgi:SOS response associated peptidase (SRAP)